MRRRVIRNGLIAVAAVLVLAIAAGAVAIARFDPNSFKPRIVAAVRQATGRQLALNGPVSLHPSLWPTVALHDVTLANPPGFSRPDMATLQQLDVQLALWPLLFNRVEIDRLVLVKPDLRLETNARGQSNWIFARKQAAQPTQPAGSTQAGGTQSSPRISVNRLSIRNGTLAYRNDATGRTMLLALHSLAANADSAQRPLHVTADATYDGSPFTLTATLGPIARLLEPAATTPWPVQATLQSGAAKLSADGSVRQPLQGKGYDVALVGNLPDLAALGPLLPGTRLPPLHDVRFSTRLRDQGKPMPEVTRLTLQVGASDLGAIQPGLRLQALDIAAPALDQPMQLHLRMARGGVPLRVAGTLGPPDALFARTMRGEAPWPVHLTGKAAGARMTVQGRIAEPMALKGVDLRITGQAADLAALAPLAHRTLPALKAVAFSARLTDGSDGLARQVTLRDLKLTTADADVSGEIGVALGARPDVTAKLKAGKIDADALLASFRSAQPPPPSAASSPAPPSPAASARPAPSAKPAGSGSLIPDTPIRFGLLRRADADIALTANSVQSGGVPYRNVDAHLVLRNGRLRLDPFVADLPEGHLALTFATDGSQAKPPVAVTVHAPGLALKPLLAALHQPEYATGKLEVLADLHGAGTSAHAIAADLNGSIGLAMEHGTVDARLLEKLLGPTLAKANLLDMVGHGGTSQVECFAFRMNARHGIGQLRTLVLSSSLVSLDGTGSIDLGRESLALNLRPQGRIGGTGFVVPLRMTGSLRDPAVAIDATRAAEANVGTLAGAVAGGATPLGAIAGVLIGGEHTGKGESCAGPLAIARGQKPPSTAARKAPAAAAKPAPANPVDLLKQLLHRG